MNVYVELVPIASGSWDEVAIGIRQHTGWDDLLLLRYEESVSRCVLDRCRLAEAVPPIDAFEGRLAGPDADVRWIRRADGSFQAWATAERPVAADRPPNAHRVDRDYVLLGHGTGAPHVFEEARYPGVRFQYPDVKDTGESVRAAVSVAEYFALRPDWPAMDSAAVQTALARPRLIAHRFLSIGRAR